MNVLCKKLEGNIFLAFFLHQIAMCFVNFSMNTNVKGPHEPMSFSVRQLEEDTLEKASQLQDLVRFVN